MSAAAPISLSSSDVEFEDPKQKPASGVPQLSSSDVEFEQPTEAEKPGFLERAYETSGLKGLVDSAKQKSEEDEALGSQAMEHLKAGRFGHAAELIAGHLAKRGGEAAMGPAGELIKGSAENAYQHGSKAVEAAKQGNTGEAIAQGAEAIPVVGPIAEQVGEPLGKDIREGNYAGAAGDVAGGTTQVLGLKSALKGFTEPPAPRTEPIPGAPVTAGEAAGPGVMRSGEQLVSKVGSAQKPVRELMENRTNAIQNAAEGVAPKTPTAEATGSAVQDAARAVTHGKEQAGELANQFADRAKQELDTTKQAAADSEKTQTQAEAERQGTELQNTAAQELDKRRAASISDAQDIAKGISGGEEELPVPEADRKIIDSLRSGNKALHSEESTAHNALTKAATDRGVIVDTKPMQDVAKSVVQLEGPARDLVTSSLPANVLKMLEKASEGEAANSPLDPYAQAMTGHNYVELKGLAETPPSGKAATRGAGGTDWQNALANVEQAAAKDGIQPLESGVPYDVMKIGRTAVGEALQAARKHFQQTGMGSNAPRVLQDLYGSMSDAMKKSLEPHEDLSQQFGQANALTKLRHEKFVDPKFIRNLVYRGDASKVISAVMRSGGLEDANSLMKALGSDDAAINPARRAAMDYILRKSTKSPSGELPGTIEPSKMDYDLAVRNAERAPALKTILGDGGYQKFLGDLEKKRLAARDPGEVRFEGTLQRIVKADMPEKAAKVGADQDVVSKLSQSNPAVVSKPIDTATGTKAVSWAERRLAGAKSASDRLSSPTLPEKGVQKVARSVAEELTPSKIVEKTANEPEYTDKLLEVIDKAPNPQATRLQLGQRVFRNVTDDAMVQGAFGSSGGVFDVGKFDTGYRAARPSLEKILPPENIKAMDGFADALKQYTLSNGIGQGGGMSSRFLVIRQIMGIGALIRGVATLNPSTIAAGATIEFGPRIWMELATHPEITNAVSASLRAGKIGAAGVGVAATAAKGDQREPSRLSHSALPESSNPSPIQKTSRIQPSAAPNNEPAVAASIANPAPIPISNNQINQPIPPPAGNGQNVTPPPAPPLVPGSGTNGIRKDTPGVPQISRHDASPDQIAELAHNTVAVANEEAQAHRIASGLPPVPPPPPAPPPPAPGVVSPDMVSATGKKIAGMPPEQRAQATSEAHHELAQALLQQGKVSGPDGKIEIITKPEQADKIAQRIINDELKKQDKEKQDKESAPTSTFRPSWKVVSSAPAQPPADLWKGKENKRLTLRDANGKTSRWELVKGVPKMVD